MYVQCTIEARSLNHCGSGKAINITYSECVFVAVGILHGKSVRRVMLPSVYCLAAQYIATLSVYCLAAQYIATLSVYCLAAQYIATLSHNWHDFRKKKRSNIKCVFSPQILCEIILILRRIQRDIIINIGRLMKILIFGTYFQKINFIFHENPCCESRVVSYGRPDRQTDRQT